jgi:excisionase family DNA binding protein
MNESVTSPWMTTAEAAAYLRGSVRPKRGRATGSVQPDQAANPSCCGYIGETPFCSMTRTSDMSTPPQSEWLTATEAASYLRIKPRTILLWARQGHIRGHILSGTRRVTWRFLRSDLDATLTEPSVALTKGRIR